MGPGICASLPQKRAIRIPMNERLKPQRHTHRYTAQSELSVDTKRHLSRIYINHFQNLHLSLPRQRVFNAELAVQYHRSLCNIDVVRSTASGSAIKTPCIVRIVNLHSYERVCRFGHRVSPDVLTGGFVLLIIKLTSFIQVRHTTQQGQLHKHWVPKNSFKNIYT